MIEIKIPGRETYLIENIVFDYNGTIAVNGEISPPVRERISKICEIANVYVLTADTYGSAAKECQGLNLKLMTFNKGDAGNCKAKIVSEIAGDRTVCFGNGYNDLKMFEVSRLSIAVLGQEGMCSELFKYSDVTVKSIEDGIDLLLKPSRLVATLRG